MFKCRSVITILSCLLWSHWVMAFEYRIEAACSSTTLAQGKMTLNESMTLGKATILVLQQHHIPFLGTEGGINSINGQPEESRKLEILANGGMRAYGWCYEHNGVIPDVMPDQITVTENDVMVWFLGHAEYINGQWINYCVKCPERS